jgi:hypothetical protein
VATMTDTEIFERTRPLLDVTVCHSNTLQPVDTVEALIDTGAAVTSFPEAMMERLGLTSFMCVPHDVSGTGSAVWLRSRLPVAVHSAGRQLWVKPLFVPAHAPDAEQPALLGRDFLSYWRVEFDLRGGRVALYPHDDVERVPA